MKTMIEINNLSKSYGQKKIFENISFSVDEGTFNIFTGRSGIGKTVLMRCIAGLEEPDSGTVSGIEEKKLSYVFQENRLIPQISVLDNLLCFCDDKTRAVNLLEKTGLKDELGKRANTLSGGMKRRLAVVRALLYGGDIFFLDEPFRETDAETTQIMRNLVKRETSGKTVFMITHELNDIDFFDAVHFEFSGSPMILE